MKIEIENCYECPLRDQDPDGVSRICMAISRISSDCVIEDLEESEDFPEFCPLVNGEVIVVKRKGK